VKKNGFVFKEVIIDCIIWSTIHLKIEMIETVYVLYYTFQIQYYTKPTMYY